MKKFIWVTASALVVAGSGHTDATEKQQPALKTVRIDTLSVRDTLYHLSGGGGNSLALIDEINGGVVLIDTKLPDWGGAVLDALESVTDLPVTTIINTHAHASHAGSNPEFSGTKQIISHENTRANMTRMDHYRGRNAASLPTTTFVDRFSLLDDLDRIDLYYFGPAHTDGDIIVVFPAKGVAYVGDLFPSKSVPVIDTANGGSGLSFPDTLAKAVAEIEGVTRVITGHAPPPMTYAGRGQREAGYSTRRGGRTTWDDFREYAEFTLDFVEAVKVASLTGKNIDEATANLTLPERWAAYDMESARASVEAIYSELGDPSR